MFRKLSKDLKKKLNGFEQRELIGPIYLNDERWKEVHKLRVDGKDNEANSLVYKIRESYGVN